MQQLMDREQTSGIKVVIHSVIMVASLISCLESVSIKTVKSAYAKGEEVFLIFGLLPHLDVWWT